MATSTAAVRSRGSPAGGWLAADGGTTCKERSESWRPIHRIVSSVNYFLSPSATHVAPFDAKYALALHAAAQLADSLIA